LILEDPSAFPELYRVTNDISLEGQKRFFFWFRVRLYGLLVASIAGAIVVAVLEVRVGAWLAFGAFLLALGAELVLATQKPEKVWYQGRAAAESAKTLTWRYVVKGEALSARLTEEEVDRRFLFELKEILQDLRDIDVSSAAGGGAQITDDMRALRALPFSDRRALYKWGRIEDQRSWYAKKALWNSKRARGWTTMVVLTEILGASAGALVATGVIDFDALGILAAVAATVTAWIQAKQHQNLATAYSVTSLELTSIFSEVNLATDEEKWDEFVGQAEEAISREHTLWRASRGVRLA
jgi:hypothetical protein